MFNPVTAAAGAISNYVLAQRRTVTALVGGMFGYQTVAQRNLGLFWDYYATNEIVFAAVIETVQGSSVIPFVTERFANGHWMIQPDDDPVSERLANPNSQEDAIKFMERCDTELVVTGNAIVAEIDGGTATEIGELRLLPTRNVWVRRDKITNVIVEYIYDPKKQRGGPHATLLNQPPNDALRFPPDRIIHRIYAADPFQPDWGMGPIAAALDSIEADINITLYIKEFFRLGAIPPHLLITEARLTNEQEKGLQQRWAATTGGITNSWKLGILSGVKQGDVLRIGGQMGSREIGLSDLRKNTETRILTAMNVPPIVVGAAMGLEEATYSNYEQARQAMHEENTDPLVKKRDSAWTHYIRRRLRDPNVRVNGDMKDVLAVQTRINERSERATRELQSGISTQNEARTLIGYSPTSAGDVFFIPLNLALTPVGAPIVNEERAERLSLVLDDHAKSAQVIREQVTETGALLKMARVPESVATHIMLVTQPRDKSVESKMQFARRVLMTTNSEVIRYSQGLKYLGREAS